MLDAAVLIPMFPLAGFVTLVVLGRRLGDPGAGWVATAAMGGAFLSACVTFAGLLELDGHHRHHVQTLFTWLDVGSFKAEAALLVDPLSITMALFVTGVGALIHLYSVGYMHGDPKYSKFFVYLNLFAFSMLMLVLGSNMLVSFLGWEGVGACSYLLISFWFERKTAATAGKKAFVTNRIGDVGFLLAMFLVFHTVGSIDFADLNSTEFAAGTATAVALLLFLGACGKSAQLPLYVWLPDAMEGPTPVSALIHAATMVTAGVYLMARTAPVLAQSADAATVVAVVGAATALIAATIACAQNDIKKVLAYSTISQLGFMFLAVGSENYVAAIFHMVTHAFFKALLFLGAGSVIHGLHHEQDMKRMGGLRKYMPVTAVTFLVGWLAIAGIPPFAGFWSKDDILLAAFHKSPVLWAVGLAAALLTAYYMTRQVILVFFGDERFREGDAHEPHESPWTMTAPLVVLAVLAALGGALNLPFGHDFEVLHNFLHPVFGEAMIENDSSGTLIVTLAALATATALGGLIAARRTWWESADRPSMEPRILQTAYAADDVVDTIVVRPSRVLADAAATVDTRGIDGAVNGVAALAQGGGERLRATQTGYVRNYALLVAAGTAASLVWIIFRTVG